MTLIIAGYTAAPAAREDATIYYQRLATAGRAGGLEVAWKGDDASPAEIAFISSLIPASWVFTVNAIPSTFQAWAKDHRFGLASPDETGRQAAVAAAVKMSETIKTINDAAGRQLILAVEIQSAPGFNERAYNPVPDALSRSLQHLGGLDWGGAAVMVEHCDAFVAGQAPQKGFLTLTQEIAVLRGLAGSPVGLSLNWGRSLIELRDPQRVAEHASEASASGLLRGFTLSGSADADNSVGKAWADSHLAFADTLDRRYAEPASLMTTALAEASLRQMRDLLFLAVKTNWPGDRKDPSERAASVIANFDTVVDLIDRTGNPTITP